MKKRTSVATMGMEMCMRGCCICMAFGALISDAFSISKAKHAAA